ncbi:glycosyltransferase [Janthinobacterium sp. FW305-128]|uniref:glycosyltransferase n=1 Tax=Janthinobacterium sp. FW305-128 TaxID=2775055 RepID=UPI001E3A912D|nr:glycosyltransferase [Janthinobacterium sp. FW305-128]MCC7679929.1 glycosyltransferase [Janthinobacterium sp. FW305-128]
MNHKKVKLDDRNGMWFFLYFLVLLSLGWLVRDVASQPSLWATMAEFVHPQTGTSMGDPKSFAMGAMNFYQFGMITEPNMWLIRLWPPGFMFLEGMILKLFGVNAPVIFVLLILASLMGAFMLFILRKHLMLLVSPAIATLLPLLPFAFPLPRFFLLQPNGLILGESFAIIFFLTALLLLPLALRLRSIWVAIGAGLLLALSAYFRSQFELIVVVLSAAGVCLAILLCCLLLKKEQAAEHRSHIKWMLALVAVAMITANLSMLPWRVKNYFDPYLVNMSWVQTSQLIYINASKTNKELLDVGGEWVINGGGNIACNVEPSYCGNPGKDGFYQALIKHPRQWFGRKISLLGDYWFSSLADLGGVIRISSFMENTTNFFYLLCVLATLPLLWMVRRHRNFLLYGWICGAFYSCFAVVLSLVHLETRYFFVIKIFALFSTIGLSCLAWGMRHPGAELEDGGTAPTGNAAVKSVPAPDAVTAHSAPLTVGAVEERPLLSVVVAVTHDECPLEKFYARLVAALTPLSSNIEILLVDVSGGQRCWPIIEQLAEVDARVVGLQLSHSLRASSVYKAGFDYSRGNWVVLMSGDLNDRPEDIPRLYAKACEGYDIVIGRVKVQQDSLFLRCKAWIAQQLFGHLAETVHANGFSIIARQSLHRSGRLMWQLPALDKQLEKRGVAAASIDLGKAGTLKLTAGDMAQSAGTSGTAIPKPMLLAAAGGMLTAIIAFLCGIVLLWQMLFDGVSFSGAATLITSLYFLGGLVISLLGFIGASLYALNDEMKHVPKYSVWRSTENVKSISIQSAA